MSLCRSIKATLLTIHHFDWHSVAAQVAISPKFYLFIENPKQPIEGAECSVEGTGSNSGSDYMPIQRKTLLFFIPYNKKTKEKTTSKEINVVKGDIINPSINTFYCISWSNTPSLLSSFSSVDQKTYSKSIFSKNINAILQFHY